MNVPSCQALVCMALDEWHPEPDGDAPFPYGKTRESGSSGFKTRKQGMSFSIKVDSGSLVSTLLLTPPNKQKVSNNNKKPDTQEIHWVFFEARAYVQVFEDTVGKAMAVSMACQTSEEGFCLPAYERRKEVWNQRGATDWCETILNI